MGVIAVTKIWQGRGATFSSEERTYKQVFQVITDAFPTGPLEVGFAFGIPRWGDPYVTDTEFDLGAFALKIDPEQQSDPNDWKVTVDYSSRIPENRKLELAHLQQSKPEPKTSIPKKEKDGKGQGFTPSDNPLTKPPRISWDFQQFQKPATDARETGVRIGRNGKTTFPFVPFAKDSLTNTSGEPYEALMVDDSRPILVVEQNLATFDHDEAETFRDTVNKKTFLGYKPGVGKINRIAAAFEFENGVPYWRRTVEIHFRKEGWDTVVLNQGIRVLLTVVPNNQTPDPGTEITLADWLAGKPMWKHATDRNGRVATRPLLLAQDGKRILRKEEDPIYIVFRFYDESDFSKLKLPVSILEVPKLT